MYYYYYYSVLLFLFSRLNSKIDHRPHRAHAPDRCFVLSQSTSDLIIIFNPGGLTLQHEVEMSLV